MLFSFLEEVHLIFETRLFFYFLDHSDGEMKNMARTCRNNKESWQRVTTYTEEVVFTVLLLLLSRDPKFLFNRLSLCCKLMALDCFHFLLFLLQRWKKSKYFLKNKTKKKTREHTGTPFSDSDGLACVGSIAYVTIECGPRPS